MKQTHSWEDNCFLASQEIAHILRNPYLHYYVNKIMPLVPVLSQTNPIHILSYHLRLSFKVVLYSTTLGQHAGPVWVDSTPGIPAFSSVTLVPFVLTYIFCCTACGQLQMSHTLQSDNNGLHLNNSHSTYITHYGSSSCDGTLLTGWCVLY